MTAMITRPHLELPELSRLGFGCYRTDNRSRVHAQAMHQALTHGINLFDTASSYMDGRSEELIGRISEEISRPIFIITKLGYISPASAEYLSRHGVDVGALHSTVDGTPYSLDVKVLRLLFELSRKRLRRSKIDAVLVHNPERLLEAGVPQEELKALLASAFEWLDSEVHAGRLRHYGISSNHLPTAPNGDALDLDFLVQIALQHGTKEQPLLMQFPLNLLEQAAAIPQGRPSLLQRAQQQQIRTLTNRPLNGVYKGEPLRLAQPCLEGSQEEPWDECTSLVSSQLQAIASEQSWQDFRPMQFLRDYQPDGNDVDLIDAAWTNQIRPFLDTLYDQNIPDQAAVAFERLYRNSIRKSRVLQAERTKAVLADLKAQGQLSLNDEESLAVAACRFCLEKGADHVLVGMRRPEYVNELMGSSCGTMEASAQ
jgi:aryl-alcohol dehydrogenase-like predicted oxidoreductase